MNTRMLGMGTLTIALLVALAIPFVAHAGTTLKIAAPADGATIYSDSTKLFIVSDVKYKDTPVQVYLNGKAVKGYTPPTGLVGGMKKGKNTIRVVAGSLEASVTIESEP